MAEIIGLTSFAVGTPGVALAFCECGKYLLDRFNAFKNTPENILELKEFFRDLHQGQLKTNIEMAEWAFTVVDLDPALKSSLKNHLNKLRTELAAADKALDELFHKDGSLRRRTRYLEFLGLTRARKVMENLQKWQDVFRGSIDLVCMRRLVVPDAVHLTHSKFRPFVRQDSQYCSQLQPGSHIWQGVGEVSDGKGKVRQISFIMERMEPIEYASASDAKEIASDLARRLAASSSNRGILKCLGYRETSGLELVFEVPHEFTQPQTLKDLITGDAGKGYGGGRPIDYRFRLARQISEAVLSVHTAQLVHKNIRPETILLFQKGPDKLAIGANNPVGLGVPFLTDWKMVRQACELSSRKGGDNWMADIYRHPRRQGLQPETRYNMKHDIYSLGICLLEIGLWEPFIIQKNGQPFMCDKYCRMAVASNTVREEHSDQIAKLTYPKTVQDVMISLAKDALPQKMGLAFTDLVLSCLTCLEGISGDPNDETEVGVKFNETILHSFPNMLV